MRSITASTVLFMALWAAASVCSAQDPRFEEYEQRIKEGEQQLAVKDLAAALRAFEQADRLEFFELTNYHALVRIAEVQCLQGNASLGKSNLADFRCMLDVESGKLPCYTNEETEEANPALSRQCFERMCGYLELSSYANPSASVLKSVEKDRKEAARVDQVCAAPAAK